MGNSAAVRDNGLLARFLAMAARVQGPVGHVLGVACSVAALCVVLVELHTEGAAPLLALIGSGPAFWAAFMACLLVEPLTDYAILRRLLGVSRQAVAPLIRKQALNSLLFGYAGDTYFMTWLRRHIGDTRKAFATVCDLAIGSALANNAATVIVLLFVWGPVQQLAGARIDAWTLCAAGALILVPALLMAWRRSHAPAGAIGVILLFQGARTTIITLLVALTWHLALPEVALSSWLLLMAARLVVSRLPIVPNKDLAFAGLVSLFMGADSRIAPMVAAVALLSLVAHGFFMLALSILPRARASQEASPVVPMVATEA